MTEQSRFTEAFLDELMVNPAKPPGPAALNERLTGVRRTTLNGRQTRWRAELLLQHGFEKNKEKNIWERKSAVITDVPLIEGQLKRTLREAIVMRAPEEAVGVIYGGQVYCLHNMSATPDDSFKVDLKELRSLLQDILHLSITDIQSKVFFWHSHPSGGVGPSRFDMQNRTPLSHHLVVALVDNEIVPTWY